jgi:hypothetical protein
MHDEASNKDKHKDMIIARNSNSQERRVLAQLIVLIILMVEQKINLALYRIFFLTLNLEKEVLLTFITRLFR